MKTSVRLRSRPGNYSSSGPGNRRATVLLVVVVIVMLLALAAYKFMLTMQTEHLAVAMNGDRLRAEQAAWSARDLLSILLEQPRATRDAMGGVVDNPVYFGGNAASLLGGMSSGTGGAMGTPGLGDSGGTLIGSPSLSSSSYSGSAGSSGSSDLDALVQPNSIGLIAYTLPVGDGLNTGGVTGSSFTTASTYSSTSSSPTVGLSGSSSLDAVEGATGGGLTRYGARNESAKLHLAKVLQWEYQNPGAGIAALMQLPGMDEATADAILDWIDSDDQPRTNGAESDFYATLTRPMSPRNNLPPDIDELLFVKGVTRQKLFGDEPESLLASATGQTAVGQSFGNASTTTGTNASRLAGSGASSTRSNSGSLGIATEGEIRPWAELLTVYSAERNETYTGRRRLFVNSEDMEELHSELKEFMPEEWADFIVMFRQYESQSIDSETLGDGGRSSSRRDDEEVTIDFEVPAKVPLTNPLDLIGRSISLETEDDEVVTVVSPFGADNNITPEFLAVLDRITCVPERRVVGRINVNEAPAEVLLALPGMTTEIVESIMEDRSNQADSMTGDAALDVGDNQSLTKRAHSTWLLTEGIVDLTMMRELLPNVTCGGDVYRADVWGMADDRSPPVHFQTVLDASTSSCRPVFFREQDAPRSEMPLPPQLDGVMTPGSSSSGSSSASGFGSSAGLQ